MKKTYLQETFSDLVETLPERLSLQLRANFPGASNCYNLTRGIPALKVDTGESIVIEPGGHYSIVQFQVCLGIVEVSLCVLEAAGDESGRLISGIDLTVLAVCQCNRVDDDYLHLVCDPYEPEYPPIDFPEIPSIN